MIQFNLLPDVKLEYLKAQRAKRLVMLISVIVGGGSLVITGLLYSYVNFAQKSHIDNLTDDITSVTNQIQSIEGIDKVLTVQQQIDSLQGLHDEKPIASRLPNYIEQLVPSRVSLTEVELQFEESVLIFSGTTRDAEDEKDAFAIVNKFVDTLKFTQYSTPELAEAIALAQQDGLEPEELPKPFETVVLTDFSREQEESTFEITVTFDPVIFSATEEISLAVPQQFISTRSNTDKPDQDLFQNLENEEDR